MKPYKIYLAFIGASIALSVSAQPVTPEHSPLYVKIYGAYGFVAPGSYKGEPRTFTSSVPARFNVAKIGMGSGIRAGAGFGIILNEFINIGIDGEYLRGNKIRLEEVTTPDEASYDHFYYQHLEARRTYTNEIISIIPHIVFKAISKPKYYIYDRLGVVVGIPLNMTEQYFQHINFQKYTNLNPGDIEYSDRTATFNGKHTLKTAIGYQFSLGVQTVLGEKLRGFFEITAYCISFNRNKYEDKERLVIYIRKNKGEVQQPTVYDHSRFINQYINSGETGTNVRGVPYNHVFTTRYSQDPVVMNAITAGIGLAYRF